MRRMVRSASCQPTSCSETLTEPLMLGDTTMLRPLNSAIARTTVRMSAPSTSRLKLPSLARVSPTCFIALGSAATDEAGSAAATPMISTRADRSLPVRIGLIPLLRQRNRYGLGGAIGGQCHDHPVPLHPGDDAVLYPVAHSQHVALAAGVLDHRELVFVAPHDPHHLHATDIDRRIAADID